MTNPSPLNWVLQQFIRSIPGKSVRSICEWGKQFVKLPGSAMSKTFDPDITPWIKEPLDSTDLPERRKTVFVKPIQSGGSVVGEVRLCYVLATKSSGDVQYNWQNDEQADARWNKRVERILRACDPVMVRWPAERFKAIKGQVLFPHANFTMQGVLTNRNVASDSIKYQINEECHDEEGWLPGRLDQAFGRTTAFWDHSILVISNAGRKESELHQKFEQGTQQHWEVKCPGCGLYHTMRTEWSDKEPHLGGLRYDSDKYRRGENDYDYAGLQATVRHQLPCGYTVHDLDKLTRRQLSLSGRYGNPRNAGAAAGIASYTLEAVSIDYISWLDLIMQKHAAIKAMKYNNLEPWKKYLRERECRFASDEDRPFFQKIVLSERNKDRDGLPNRLVRFGALDRQQGVLLRGELPHWWGVIRDVALDQQTGHIHSLLVWEGKLETDEQAADVMKRHNVDPKCVAVDSGDDTTHVYKFCLQHGFNAIKGGGAVFYPHPDNSKKVFSVEKPLHGMLNAQPKFEYVLRNGEHVRDDREPLFWFYSKPTIRDRFAWLSSGGAGVVTFETPGDVSDDYRKHLEAEELREQRNKDRQTRARLGATQRAKRSFRLRMLHRDVDGNGRPHRD
ncbi:MAG TPA: phage terminase large subunit family protein [Verrucomicrobiae bacterium]|nr:phage terminase large subunit family protein [Verrucomicrobiae bacterium]